VHIDQFSAVTQKGHPRPEISAPLTSQLPFCVCRRHGYSLVISSGVAPPTDR
jgi:hypothetical protein